jgi:hypothetical protein
MDWLTENWLWILFGAIFLWMHLRMHGGHGASGEHGGHGGCGGGHGGHGREPAEEESVHAGSSRRGR